MTTEMIIIHIFCYVDDIMRDIPKHPQAKLYPSELVTIGILFALKGGHFRAFWRWLKRDYDALFGGLPDRTRVQRSLAVHEAWLDLFLQPVSLFSVMDSYPVELLFPIRQGRTQRQIGRKGRDKGRWIMGGRYWTLLNTYACFVEWNYLSMDQPDKTFNRYAEAFQHRTITLADTGFRAAEGVPVNVKLCQRGTWNNRMVIETVFSMLTVVCKLKHLFHRVERYLFSRLACVAAMFNVLYALFHQLHPEASPYQLSIAEFSL